MPSSILTEQEARRIASEWIDSLKFEERLVVVASREAPRSWVFATGFASGEQGFGNLPVVVGKASGTAQFSREANIEFYEDPSILDRLVRSAYRRFKY